MQKSPNFVNWKKSTLRKICSGKIWARSERILQSTTLISNRPGTQRTPYKGNWYWLKTIWKSFAEIKILWKGRRQDKESILSDNRESRKKHESKSGKLDEEIDKIEKEILSLYNYEKKQFSQLSSREEEYFSTKIRSVRSWKGNPRIKREKRSGESLDIGIERKGSWKKDCSWHPGRIG